MDLGFKKFWTGYSFALKDFNAYFPPDIKSIDPSISTITEKQMCNINSRSNYDTTSQQLFTVLINNGLQSMQLECIDPTSFKMFRTSLSKSQPNTMSSQTQPQPQPPPQNTMSSQTSKAQFTLKNEMQQIIKDSKLTQVCLLNMINSVDMNSIFRNSSNNQGSTPMTLVGLASLLGLEGIVAWLIYNGAMPSTLNQRNKDALFIFINNQIEIINHNKTSTQKFPVMNIKKIKLLILLLCSCKSGSADASWLSTTIEKIKPITFVPSTTSNMTQVQKSVLHLLVENFGLKSGDQTVSQRNTNPAVQNSWAFTVLQFLLQVNNEELRNGNIVKTICDINVRDLPLGRTPLFFLLFNISDVQNKNKSTTQLSQIVKLFLDNNANIFMYPNPALPVDLNICDTILTSIHHIDPQIIEILKGNSTFQQRCRTLLSKTPTELTLTRLRAKFKEVKKAYSLVTGINNVKLENLLDKDEPILPKI